MRLRKSERYPPLLTKEERASFLRTGRWRFVEWLDRGEQALHEIGEDPFERRDVSAKHPSLLARFLSSRKRSSSMRTVVRMADTVASDQ